MDWSKEEKEFLIRAKAEGRPTKHIAVAMAKKFGKRRKPSAINAYYRLIKSNQVTVPNTKNKRKKGMVYVKYTQELIDFVHNMYLNGYSKERCIEGVKEQHDIVLTNRQVTYILYEKIPTNKLKTPSVAKPKTEEKVWANDTATRKQCFKMIDLGMPNLSTEEKNRLTNEMYKTKQFTKEEAFDIIQGFLDKRNKKVLVSAPKPKMSNSQSRKGMSEKDAGKLGGTARKYSKQEEQQILNCKDVEEAIGLAESFGRSAGAISHKYYVLKRRNKSTSKKNTKKSVKPNKATVKVNDKQTNTFTIPKPSKTVKHEEMVETIQDYLNAWTPEKELDLLINFYELSIDEAKARYGFSYEKIAGKLESLINSNNPDKIALVMEASKVVRQRKAAMIAELKNGFWKRRKAKKQAKREAKEKRRIQRLENKLKKMKGDN